MEACRWEHVISDEVEARLVEVLGHPTTCPHGNPIPGAGGTEPVSWSPCPRAGGATTSGWSGSPSRWRSTSTRLSYLSDAGFVPGTEATVASRAPDGTLILDLGARTIALGPGPGPAAVRHRRRSVGPGGASRQHVRPRRHVRRSPGGRPGRPGQSYAGAGAVIIGAPFDGGTSHRPGARFGPQAIRITDYLPARRQPAPPGARRRPADRARRGGRGRRGDARRRDRDVDGPPGGGRAAVRRPGPSRSSSAATTPSPGPTSPAWLATSDGGGCRSSTSTPTPTPATPSSGR